jgi:cyanophycinase
MENNQRGALALVGSGEYLPKAQALETELLRLGISRGKSNTYIQIPTAAGKEGDDRLDFWRDRGADQGARIGCEVKYLPVLTRNDAQNPQWIEEIKSAGLIYFSGGDPVHLSEVFSETPMWQAIVTAWQEGASLAGCSAGAMAFCGKIIGMRKSHISPGLNLLPEIEGGLINVDYLVVVASVDGISDLLYELQLFLLQGVLLCETLPVGVVRSNVK